MTENFGVQAGYVRLHEINQNSGSGATLVTQTATGHSTYVAGTARLPLGKSSALTGELGVSFGKVSSVNPSTVTTNPLLGSNTALLSAPVPSTLSTAVCRSRLSWKATEKSQGKSKAIR